MKSTRVRNRANFSNLFSIIGVLFVCENGGKLQYIYEISAVDLIALHALLFCDRIPQTNYFHSKFVEIAAYK